MHQKQTGAGAMDISVGVTDKDAVAETNDLTYLYWVIPVLFLILIVIGGVVYYKWYYNYKYRICRRR